MPCDKKLKHGMSWYRVEVASLRNLCRVQSHCACKVILKKCTLKIFILLSSDVKLNKVELRKSFRWARFIFLRFGYFQITPRRASEVKVTFFHTRTSERCEANAQRSPIVRAWTNHVSRCQSRNAVLIWYILVRQMYFLYFCL